VKTGILGLDKMLNGGLIEGRPYLIIGGPGAGKSILAIQFLMISINRGESGLYITLDEPYNEIRQNMATFGWNTSKIRILDLSPEGDESDPANYGLDYLFKELKNELDTQKHKRVAFDSTTTLRMLDDSDFKARRRISSIMKLLAKSQCTSLLICEAGTEALPVESFLARGVIKLYTTTVSGEKIRAIGIEKMRGTAFDEHIRPLSISNQGIQVAPDEFVFESFESKS
ncbi:MAG: ATPase, partial [Thermoplasmata archaeon]|nr:ATPase [Thermoplasmata archaeon]